MGFVTSRAFRERLARRARNSQVTLVPDVIDRLETYVRLLARWNAKVNLTSLPLDTPTDETFDRLLIEPLAAARFVEDSWSPWFDIGSGGGSPAIPLKLLKPSLRLTMIESKARKAAFLREAVRSLELDRTFVESARFEEVVSRADSSGMAGLVTVRAVRPDAQLIGSAARILRPGGSLLAFRQSPVLGRYAGFEMPSASLLVSSHRGQSHLLRYLRSR